MRVEQAKARARREAFLAALTQGRNVSGAALAAGINRTLLYKWRERMPDFAGAWDEALETAADLVEDEALRRAMDGVQKPAFYRGEQIGTVTTYSDRLLGLLLQRRRPVPRTARSGGGPRVVRPTPPVLSPTVSMDETPATTAPQSPEEAPILSPVVSIDAAPSTTVPDIPEGTPILSPTVSVTCRPREVPRDARDDMNW
jgi:transposase-like protein